MSPKTLKTRIAFIVTGTGRNWFNCADNVSFYNVARRKGSDVQSIIRTPDGLAGGRPLAEASRAFDAGMHFTASRAGGA